MFRSCVFLCLAVLVSTASHAQSGRDPNRIPRTSYDDEGQVLGLIKLKSAEDVAALRRRLIRFVWKRGVLPERMPDRVEKIAMPDAFRPLASIANIERLTIALPHGFESIGFHFRPRRCNERLIILHGGHGNSIGGYGKRIEAMLKAGFAVLGLDMPVYGANVTPGEIDTVNMGRVRIRGGMHSELALLERPGFSAFSLFLEPVAVALNHLLSEYRYNHVSMTGVSGGGWTTTVYAALDPRIKLAMPVAGSSAFFLLFRDGLSYGDYEQTWPPFYAIANYLELYVLGAAEPDRIYIQVHNQFEPGSFGGLGGLAYAGVVRKVVSELGSGGSYRLHLDDTITRHDMSDQALGRLLVSALEHPLPQRRAGRERRAESVLD